MVYENLTSDELSENYSGEVPVFFNEHSPSFVGIFVSLVYGSVHDCEYFLEQGMDVEQRCDDASHRCRLDNFTPLQIAAYFSNYEVVDLLIQARANINVPPG